MTPDVRNMMDRLPRRIIRLLKWTFCIVIILFGLKYCFDAKARIHANTDPEGWRTESSSVHQGVYIAKSIFISHHTILLRLYRAGDPTLLAERIYTEHGVDLHWSEHELIYDTSDESYLGGGIQLPPTRIDRLLARLP